MSRSKDWCFTINNYTFDDEKFVRGLQPGDVVGRGTLGYLVAGFEVGESGTRHIQGYLELGERVRLTNFRRTFVGRGHWEARRGSADQAADYCKKDGEFIEVGSIRRGKQGERVDLEEVREKIVAGATDKELADNYFSKWVMYRRAFAEYRKIISPPVHRPNLRVFVLCGKPGTGKSRYVYHRHPGVFSVPTTNLTWFDGYNGEREVLFDDYRGEGSNEFLLRLLDLYPMQVPIKGGFVAWNPVVIWMTSNIHPQDWHEEHQGALMRRIHVVKTLHLPIDFDNEEVVGELDAEFVLE